MTPEPQPSQSNPARTIAVTNFTCPDLSIGPITIALSKCGPRFIKLLAGRLAAYSPPHFVPISAPLPWPNNNIISGFISTPIVSQKSEGKYTVELPIYMESDTLGDGNKVVVDEHEQTAKGNISDLPSDPDSLFTALTPMLTVALDKLAAEFAESARFSNYQWGSSVISLNQAGTTITIAAGGSQNIQPGNLLEVAREQGTTGVYQSVAVVRVLSVTSQSSLCAYYGAGNQGVQVGDLAFIYQFAGAGTKHSSRLGAQQAAPAGGLASTGSLPVEMGLSMNFVDGQDTAQINLDPPNMMGPPQPSMSFFVQYISIFARVPHGQQVHCMVDGGNAGGHWIQLFPQGTFAGFDVYVGSRLVAFVIAPIGTRSVAATRSDTKGTGVVDVHFTGSFSS